MTSRYYITLFVMSCSLQLAFGIPYTAVKGIRVEGTVVAFVWLSAMQHEEDGTNSMVVASERAPRYFVRLKITGIPEKTKKELNYIQSERIRHVILDHELKQDEILVAIESERLKEMKVGAILLLEGYTLFLDDSSLHPSHKALKLNGKKGTVIGLPFPKKPVKKDG